MNEDLREFGELIQTMEAAPKVEASSEFTRSVMSRVRATNRGTWYWGLHQFLRPVKHVLDYQWAQRITESNRAECSFYFFITGFFYLIMGFVLMAGLKAVGSGMSVMDWIRLQPHLAIGAAILFFSLGAIVSMDGRSAVKIARLGLLFFVCLTIANGVLMRPFLKIPYAGIFLIGFVVTSVSLGIILAFTVQAMDLRLKS
jgi:hypothetical protein